jgi:uncharacterized membrane protein
MAVYHFTWDLGFFGLTAIDAARDPAWRLFAQSIAAGFLLLVGVSLVLATRHGLRLVPYLKRLALIAGGAALVSLGTWLFTPASFVYFGILHCIAVASVLALPFLRLPIGFVLLSACAAVALPWFAQTGTFDVPWLWWTGLGQSVPATNDYVPILPWFGAVLAGIALARFALPRLGPGNLLARDPRSAPARLLALGGRHSLVVYLIHQPLLIGLVWLFTILTGLPPPTPPLIGFVPACVASCEERGTDRELCRTICACVAEDLRDTRLLSRALGEALTAPEQQRLADAVSMCRTPAQPTPRLEPEKR